MATSFCREQPASLPSSVRSRGDALWDLIFLEQNCLCCKLNALVLIATALLRPPDIDVEQFSFPRPRPASRKRGGGPERRKVSGRGE